MICFRNVSLLNLGLFVRFIGILVRVSKCTGILIVLRGLLGLGGTGSCSLLLVVRVISRLRRSLWRICKTTGQLSAMSLYLMEFSLSIALFMSLSCGLSLPASAKVTLNPSQTQNTLKLHRQGLRAIRPPSPRVFSAVFNQKYMECFSIV